MTAKLLGGMKHKSLSPKPMDTEREKKRKESEPCIDVGDLEDENPGINPEEEPTDAKKWMKETMKDLKQRSDEMSDLERSMSTMQWELGGVRENIDKVTSSLAKLTEGNATRDKKLDDLIASLSTGLAEKEKKTEERIDNMEKSLGARMDERFSDFERRISSIEKSTGGAGHTRPGSSQGGWGPTPTSLKAVIHGFKPDATEQEVKRIVAKILSDTGMNDEHLVDYPAIPITHAFVELNDTRIRDRFVRSASMRRYELDERTIRISQALEPEERFGKKRLGYIKFAINKSTGIKLHWIRLNLEKRSVSVYGQLAARVENNGFIKYYKYENVEDEVRNLMDKWLTKNL